MSKLRPTFIPLLIVFLSGIWVLLVNIQKSYLPKYQVITIVFPRDKKEEHRFTTFSVLNQIKKKKKLQIELNEDKLTNQKKISFIQYEARKLKYTKDTNSVVSISMKDEVSYSEIMQLINIFIKDGHKRYVLLNNQFIIFGEYPSIKNTTKKPELIYL